MKHNKKHKKIKKILKKHWVELTSALMIFLVGVMGIFPAGVKADDIDHPTSAEQRAVHLMVAEIENSYVPYGSLPTSAQRVAPKTITVMATAYTSEVAQTDSTPFTTASGTTVRDGVIAANFLPIGTKVKIPNVYGDQIFTVEDRMNARYTNRVDIWMEDIGEAREFGVQKVQIEIYQ